MLREQDDRRQSRPCARRGHLRDRVAAARSIAPGSSTRTALICSKSRFMLTSAAEGPLLPRCPASPSSIPIATPRLHQQCWRTRALVAVANPPGFRGTALHRRHLPRPSRSPPRLRLGGTDTCPVGSKPTTPSAPSLTMAVVGPRSRRALPARCGSVSPTATSHSARFPTTMSTCGRTAAISSLASPTSPQNWSR